MSQQTNTEFISKWSSCWRYYSMTQKTNTELISEWSLCWWYYHDLNLLHDELFLARYWQALRSQEVGWQWGGVGGGGGWRLYLPLHCHHKTECALRQATMWAILMFHLLWSNKVTNSIHTPQSLLRKESQSRTELRSVSTSLVLYHWAKPPHSTTARGQYLFCQFHFYSQLFLAKVWVRTLPSTCDGSQGARSPSSSHQIPPHTFQHASMKDTEARWMNKMQQVTWSIFFFFFTKQSKCQVEDVISDNETLFTKTPLWQKYVWKQMDRTIPASCFDYIFSFLTKGTSDKDSSWPEHVNICKYFHLHTLCGCSINNHATDILLLLQNLSSS